MATSEQINELFARVAAAGTNQSAAGLSETNLPDVRNLPRSEGAGFVGPAEAAFQADLAPIRRPGVPLETQTGAPKMTRFRLAFTDDTPSAIKTLQREYGQENIAVSPAGQLVIRNLMDEETGQVRDLVVDENRLSAKDLLDLTGAVPEVIGTLLAMRGGRAVPKVGTMTGAKGFGRDLLAGAIGGQAGGEAAQRVFAENEKDILETLESRGRGAAADVALGLVTAGTPKALLRLGNKLSGPLAGHQGLVQKEAMEAIGRIKGSTGIEIPLSIGEETGFPGVMKSEALIEKVPFSTSVIRKQKAAQEQSLRDVQRYMFGQGPLPSEAAVGLDAIDSLRRLTSSAVEGQTLAKRELSETASREILNAFSDMSMPERQLFQRPVGKAIRSRAEAELEGFKNEARRLYGEVYATPGANDAIIPTAPLKATASEIKANLPKKTVTVENLSEMVDAQGRPIIKTTTGKEVLREFVPKELKKFLDELSSELDPKMPLNEVVQMRTMVNDAINQSEILPGISNRYLKQVSHALTEALEQGVKEAPDPMLAQRLKTANEFYKTNRPRFEEAGIVDIFRESTNPGFIQDDQIVRRVASGDISPSRYVGLREFLGKDSLEFKMFKRSVLDDIYETSKVQGQNYIDAQTFLNQVGSINREVGQDLFGDRGYEMLRTARLAGEAQGKISNVDLDELLASGTPTAEAFRKLAEKQQNLDSLYANNVIKRFVKGEVGSEVIKSDEFVARFLDTAKKGDVEHVMALLQDNPELTRSIRRKTIEKIFIDAARSPTPEDLTRNVRGDPTKMVTGSSLLKALGSEANQEKLRTVIGNDTMALLKDLIRVEAALGYKEDVAKSVGGLVGGTLLSRLMQFNLKDAAAIAKYRTMAWMLADPRMRRYLTRQVPAADTEKFGRAIIASGPFLEAAAEELESESGIAAFFHNLNQSFEGAFNPQPQANQGQQNDRINQLFQQAAGEGR